jgi:hypothetical protein
MAEERLAVTKRFYNCGMAVRLMFVLEFAGASTPGVSGKGIVSHFLAYDLAVGHFENQET